MAEEQINMMMSVLPGTMTGFAALNSGLVSINNAFLATTRAFDAQFGLVNTMLATTGVVVAQLGMDAMDAFGKFEQGMKIVQMVSGQTKSDIEQLSQAANQFSVQYRVDIDQITEGLQTLGRAGLNSATEQTEVLQNGLNTAKLEGRDLNGVLEELIQNTALLGGDLKSSDFGEQSQYVNDLLVATSMTAPITTHDVSETLKYSGGIAAAAGANIESEQGKAILEDYMGTIAAFAQKGVTGSIAGTALRAFFNKPATQDSSVTDALASIKLKPEYLWEDDEETMKPVSEQIRIITDQMDDLDVSTMDRLQIWSKIVGGKMGQQMMKLESDDIKELTKDIQAADDASDLAAGSMKTYEANVKALGESSEVLKRNVGDKLVFFANPILEILNKITQFANQDVMSWPIAATIIGFIGMLGHKLRGVLSVVKSEMATLIQAARAGEQYFLGKSGKAIGPNGEIVDKKGSSGGSDSQSKPQSPSAFAKNYYGSAVSQTVDELRKKGVSDSNIAMMGRFSSLKSDTTGLGLPDKDFARIIGQTGVLSAAKQKELDSLLSGSSSARGPFNQFFLAQKGVLKPEIFDAIMKNEAAMKAFGITIADVGTKSEVAARHLSDYSTRLGTKEKKFPTTGVQENVVRQAEAHASAVKDDTSAVHQNTEAEKNNVNAQREATTQTNTMAETVIAEFNAMRIAVAEAMSGMGPKVNGAMLSVINWKEVDDSIKAQKAQAMPGYYMGQHSLYGNPYNLSNIYSSSSFGNIPNIFSGNYPNISPLMKEWLNSGLYKAFGANLTEDQMAHYLAANRIPGYNNYSEKAQEIARNNIKTYPDMYRDTNMPVYGPANDEGIKKAKEIQKNAAVGVGAGAGSVPAAIDAARREYEKEYDKKTPSPRSGPQNTNLGSGLEKELEIEKEKEAAVAAENAAIAFQSLIAKLDALTKQINAIKSWNPTEEARKKANENAALTSKEGKETAERLGVKKTDGDLMEKRARQAAKSSNQFQSYSEMSKLNMKAFNDAVKEAEVASKKYANALSVSKKPSLSGGAILAQQGVSESDINRALGKYGVSSSYGYGMMQPMTMGTPADWQIYKEHQNMLARMPSVGRGGLVGDPEYESEKNGKTFGAAFRQSFSDRINKDRSGSFLSFGSEKGLNGVMRSSTKGLSGLANKALNLSEAFGGPLMIAIMAVTTAIQLWQKAFQDYCEDLKEAGKQVKEAYSNFSSSEDNLEKAFREGNPDATDEEIDQMMYDTYSTMGEDMANAVNNGSGEWLKKLNFETAQTPEYEYDEEKDDGSIKEKKEEEKSDEEEHTEAIKANTGALYFAAAEVNKSLDRYVRKAEDSWWGLDGWTGWLTDQFGGFSDKITKGGEGSKFTDDNEFLLTQSQADENYAGNTEMAGLMMEDFKDAKGNWIKGMRTMMGEDVEDLVHTLPKETSDYLKSLAHFSAGIGQGGLTSTKNAKLQTSMKNDPKSWQKLAKELAKRDSAKKAGKNIEKQQKKIEGITNKINSTVGKGFSNTQILQAAYLQQLQDMYQITQEAIVPTIEQNMRTAMNTLSVAGQVDSNTGTTVSTTDGTYQNASIIAGLVAIIARTKAKEIYFDNAVGGSTEQGHITDVTGDGKGDDADVYWINKAREDGMDANKFYAEYSKAYDEAAMSRKNLGGFGGLNPIWDWGSQGLYKNNDKLQEGALGYLRLYHSTSKMEGYNYSPEAAAKAAQEFAIQVRDSGVPLMDAIKTAEKNYTLSDTFKQKIIDAYNAADNEEQGSGSGSGSGSGNKDNNDTGTRKERVDLVLCNRKTIPKLNVNLFKKPPSFTILNKNFKLRDVKINSEDKPKAIMAAIKNSFIDIQKRTDPKIIQDEDAVYDPAAATDGTNVPSGSAKTNTS